MEKITGEFGERYVDIFGGYIEISDIENIIKKIEKIDKSNQTISQLFNANTIAGRNHLLHSSRLGLESLERDRSFADSPRIELTCWVAGLRQINKSLERVGVKEGSQKVAVIVVGNGSSNVEMTKMEILEELGIEKDDSVVEITEDKIETLKDTYSISSNQLQVSPIEDLVIEKIALLSLEQ